jgi:hypothetical protein
MKISLIHDENNPIWSLFGEVIKVIDSKNFQEKLDRNGLNSIKNHQI